MKTRLFISRLMPLFILALSVLPWAVASQPAPQVPPPGSPFAGIWQGDLTLPQGGSIRIVFHVSAKSDGSYVATLDSPDQGTTGIPVSGVTVDKKAIRLDLAAMGGDYTGNLQPDGSLDGKWTQRGVSMPLLLKHVDKAAAVSRPQMPKAPFPYRVEDVAYTSKPGVTLSATFTLPPGQGPFPAVLLVPGSGASDRDESVFGHKPFLVLADYLTRRGIAVLRADRRGVGKSTGDLANSTDADYADDALAGLAFPKARKEVNPKSIGIVGHSEGGLVAARVAAVSPDVAFIVLMASPGLPGEQIVLAQQNLILRSRGASEEAIKTKRAQQEKVLQIVIREKDPAVAEKQLREFMKAFIPPGTPAAVVDARFKAMLSPWYRDFLVYDPRPALKKVKCPVLAVAGEKDIQVPATENLAAIQNALKEGGNTSNTEKILPGLNHLFQPAQTGDPTEYAKVEITIAPAALEFVGEWISAQVKGR